MEELRRLDPHQPVWPAVKAVDEGIALTGSMLSQGKLRLSKNVPVLLTEIGAYVWDPKAQAEGEDRPVKFRDHGPDSMRYFVRTIAQAGYYAA